MNEQATTVEPSKKMRAHTFLRGRKFRGAAGERIAELERENNLLMQAVNVAATNGILWIANVREDSHNTYQFGVAHLTAPSGGLFFTVHRNSETGQQPSTRVERLDDSLKSLADAVGTKWFEHVSPVVEKAVQMRQKAMRFDKS